MLVLNNESYEQNSEWTICSDVLGTDGVFAAGTRGRCSAGIDSTTKAEFCVKIVRTFLFSVHYLPVVYVT